MSLDELAGLLDPVRDSPLLPVFLLAAFLVAGLLFISVWLVIFQTGLLLSPPWSFLLALGGAAMSASVFWLVGRSFIGGFVARRASVRVLRAVQGVGLEGIIALRLLPVLPYTLVNVSAGALGVPYRTFLAGTVIGMAPGVLAVTLLGDRALAVLKDPSPSSLAFLLGGGLLLVGLVALLRRLIRRRQASQAAQARVDVAPPETPAP